MYIKYPLLQNSLILLISFKHLSILVVTETRFLKDYLSILVLTDFVASTLDFFKIYKPRNSQIVPK